MQQALAVHLRRPRLQEGRHHGALFSSACGRCARLSMPEADAMRGARLPECPARGACAWLQGVAGQVKDRVERAAAAKLEPFTRPLLLFPEVSCPDQQSGISIKTCLLSWHHRASQQDHAHQHLQPDRSSIVLLEPPGGCACCHAHGPLPYRVQHQMGSASCRSRRGPSWLERLCSR